MKGNWNREVRTWLHRTLGIGKRIACILYLPHIAYLNDTLSRDTKELVLYR